MVRQHKVTAVPESCATDAAEMIDNHSADCVHAIIPQNCTCNHSTDLVHGSFSKLPDDSPPTTKICVPWEAMAWPNLLLGLGPMFWNMYHCWAGCHMWTKSACIFNMPNYLLDNSKAIKSLKSHLSMPHPPKTYITSLTRAMAWPSCGYRMYPVHCSSVHFCVESSNNQVSL